MKKTKMYDNDIYKLESHYHDFYRVKNNEGIRGTAFVFDKLTSNDIQIINSFKNTIVSTGVYKYAPELHNVRIILLDRCIKEEEVNV